MSKIELLKYEQYPVKVSCLIHILTSELRKLKSFFFFAHYFFMYLFPNYEQKVDVTSKNIYLLYGLCETLHAQK